ncbi:UNVERIFIED_CONTAM: putative germin-like protein 2-3 [Sesamum latifolium]|uniref:Germin-like protein n=1 Tax=Sesamum latifolium TaxID=2727402 RepID=A0AAW2XFN4_9LAMI
MAKLDVLLITMALNFCCISLAFEPSPLQDFCVADATSSGKLQSCHHQHSFVCSLKFLFMTLCACLLYKSEWLSLQAASVQASDFSFSGLHLPGNTNNPLGSTVTPVTVAQLPGLNTLGISMARLDFAPMGVIPPHFHPRASEILTVIEGSLEVGFVTSNPDNRLITKTLQKGDVFVFPVGLVHFQRNAGNGYAVAISGLSSQNPGVVTVTNAVFGAKPDISADILAKAFQVDKSIVDQLQAKF